MSTPQTQSFQLEGLGITAVWICKYEVNYLLKVALISIGYTLRFFWECANLALYNPLTTFFHNET